MLLAVCGLFLGASLTAVHAQATDNSPTTQRPFYIIGHGANTLKKADDYLAGGANALEIDVNVSAGQPNALCIGHGPDLGTGAAKKNSMRLADFLRMTPAE